MRSIPLAFLLLGTSFAGMAQADAGQLYRVFFDWSKDELTRDARTTLDVVVTAFRSAQPECVTIAAHTDRSGPAGVNLAASRKRGNQVKAYLTEQGVPAESVKVSAYGESSPIVDTEDDVREAQNRRAEIRFQAGGC